MAATFPFRRVVGVEYSAELNARAAELFARYKSRLACQVVEFVTSDATQFDLPPDVTVIYFFNPFWGAVLQGVIAKIRQSLDSHPRRLRIIWHYEPGEIRAKLADQLPGLRQLGEVKYPECYPGPGSFAVFTASAVPEDPSLSNA
jgi:hypothetical protein